MANSSSSSKGRGSPLANLREAASRNPATETLLHAAEDYVSAKAQNLLTSTGRKLGEATKSLTDAAESGGDVGSLLTDGAKKLTEGKSPGRVAVETGAKGLKDKVKNTLSGGGKGKGTGGGKFNNIVEDCDVGVPVHVAYNQWTQYQDFSRFTRGVLSVEHTDEVNSDWKLKVAKSNRNLKASVTEQIPDKRIAWTTTGAKGTIKGVVTFHPLEENLTRILLVIEYYPSGFFEKTANMWWAASRRVRLDLKHFRRFIMTQGEETGGWRGEIRDGEVVRTHEEVVEAEEQRSDEDDSGAQQHYPDRDGEPAESDEDSYRDEADHEGADDDEADDDEDRGPDEADPDEDYDERDEDEDSTDDEADDEDDEEADDDEYDDEYDEEDDDEEDDEYGDAREDARDDELDEDEAPTRRARPGRTHR